MREIFQRMIDKEFPEDMLLSKAFSIIKKVNASWISCDDCTIKEQCHRICDDLEFEGVSLSNVPLSAIGERFEKLQFRIDYPTEYLKLLESLEYVKAQKDKINKFSNVDSRSIDIISSHIKIIEKRIKEYND
jgi:hypothetical protein